MPMPLYGAPLVSGDASCRSPARVRLVSGPRAGWTYRRKLSRYVAPIPPHAAPACTGAALR